MESTILIVHGECPDGSLCATLGGLVWPGACVLHILHRGLDELCLQQAARLAPGGVFCLADICCSKAALEKICLRLAETKSRLEVFDHHATTAWLADFRPAGLDALIVHEQRVCGSSLFLEHQQANHPALRAYAEMAAVVNDRDLWLNRDIRGRQFAWLHESMGDDSFVKRLLANPRAELTPEELFLLDARERREEKRIQAVLASMQVATDAEGWKYGVAYGSGDASDVLNRALEDLGLEYAILADLNTKKASVRGRGGLDLARWAEARGGGGHARAAGFPLRFEPPVL